MCGGLTRSVECCWGLLAVHVYSCGRAGVSGCVLLRCQPVHFRHAQHVCSCSVLQYCLWHSLFVSGSSISRSNTGCFSTAAAVTVGWWCVLKKQQQQQKRNMTCSAVCAWVCVASEVLWSMLGACNSDLQAVHMPHHSGSSCCGATAAANTVLHPARNCQRRPCRQLSIINYIQTYTRNSIQQVERATAKPPAVTVSLRLPACLSVFSSSAYKGTRRSPHFPSHPLSTYRQESTQALPRYL